MTTDLHALRVLILTKVMGWEYDPSDGTLRFEDSHYPESRTVYIHTNPPDPTTDIAAAMEALEAAGKMRDRSGRTLKENVVHAILNQAFPARDFETTTMPDNNWVRTHLTTHELFALISLPPLAICRALEQAIGGGE